MKVGSTVVCIRNNNVARGAIIPQLEPVLYTVRQIVPKSYMETIKGMTLGLLEDAIMLEEIINDKINWYGITFSLEHNYRISAFREVLPPIENMEEFVKENTGVIEFA